MKIITSYPIIENGKLVGNKIAANTLNYSSANGKPRKKGGKLVGSGKVKGFLEKSGGIATSLAGILGGGAAGAAAPSQDTAPVVPVETPKKGMKTTTKVLIGVGVAAVLGLGVYFVMKRNKGK